MRWLELDWDDEPISQFARRDRHAAVAEALLQAGHAYRCYASKEELAAMRDAARAAGKPPRYDGRWRDRDPAEAPVAVDPVIRLKAPQQGETVIQDLVQGPVRVGHDQLDDMVLLRADGTPTYMLSVVVDDHDMGITHVLRGDDHLTNTFRQYQIFQAMGWEPPIYGHIPLIHGPDGAKLSKRHGALAVEAYRDMGYLPEAMRNYLLRLGWSHGDDEIISTEQALAWFDVDAIGRSPARFDFQKLDSLNAHYIRETTPQRLADLILPDLATEAGGSLDAEAQARVLAAVPHLQQRAKSVTDLRAGAAFLVRPRPLELDEKAAGLVAQHRDALLALRDDLNSLSPFVATAIEAAARAQAEHLGVKLGAVAQPLRAALTGTTVSPPIFEMAEILGREAVLGRIDDALAGPTA